MVWYVCDNLIKGSSIFAEAKIQNPKSKIKHCINRVIEKSQKKKSSVGINREPVTKMFALQFPKPIHCVTLGKSSVNMHTVQLHTLVRLTYRKSDRIVYFWKSDIFDYLE
jgi:hypothetical protein